MMPAGRSRSSADPAMNEPAVLDAILRTYYPEWKPDGPMPRQLKHNAIRLRRRPGGKNKATGRVCTRCGGTLFSQYAPRNLVYQCVRCRQRLFLNAPQGADELRVARALLESTFVRPLGKDVDIHDTHIDFLEDGMLVRSVDRAEWEADPALMARLLIDVVRHMRG